MEKNNSMLNSKHLKNYKEIGFNKVDGWCREGLFYIVDHLNSVDFNKDGGALEIGVHHGKFYMMLNSIIDPIYNSLAIDVFESQHLNIDNSGHGSLNMFKSNLEKYDVHRGSNTTILIGDSTNLVNIKNVSSIDMGLRFISIDGGHTAEHTLCDLQTASRLISNEGCVILDDILNPSWLGVIDGTFAFLQTRPTLVPFAIGFNKLFFAKISYRERYFNSFRQLPSAKKVTSILGHKIVVIA